MKDSCPWKKLPWSRRWVIPHPFTSVAAFVGLAYAGVCIGKKLRKGFRCSFLYLLMWVFSDTQTFYCENTLKYKKEKKKSAFFAFCSNQMYQIQILLDFFAFLVLVASSAFHRHFFPYSVTLKQSLIDWGGAPVGTSHQVSLLDRQQPELLGNPWSFGPIICSVPRQRNTILSSALERVGRNRLQMLSRGTGCALGLLQWWSFFFYFCFSCRSGHEWFEFSDVG